MEIIEQGNIVRTKEYQYKCKCGCRFNATFPNDYINNTCACPKCGNRFRKNIIAELRYYYSLESMSFL